MPQYRCTFFFKDSAGYGWTETFHSNQPDLTKVIGAATDILPFRTALLGLGVQITYLRASDDLVKRDSLVKTVSARAGKQTSLDMGPADIANTCLVIRLEQDALHRRTLYMRGIPDLLVDDNKGYKPNAQWSTAFDAWTAALTVGGWAMRNKSGVIPTFVITGIAQNPVNGDITITTAAAHGLAQNQAYSIRGVKGPTFLNGSGSIFSVPSPTTFVVKSTQILSTWQGGGTVGSVGFTLNPILNAQVVRASHRISGRPFDAPLGRRKARRRV